MIDDELNNIIIRKSKWKNWKLCPALYDYNWVQKLVSEPGVEMQFGSLFHSGAKAFFDRIRWDILLECKTLEAALAYFRKDFTLNHPIVGKWFDNFLQFEAGRWQYISERAAVPQTFWPPVKTELELLSKPKGYLMHIDRIDRMQDNKLIVIDYKTDKYWNQSSLRGEIAFYNMGVNTSKAFIEPCAYIGCFNPQLNRWWSELPRPQTIAAVNRSVLQFRRNIVTGKFEPRPQRYCRYCYHNFRCLERGVFNEEFIA